MSRPKPPRKSEPRLKRIKIKLLLSGLSSSHISEASLDVEQRLIALEDVSSLSWEVEDGWMYIDIKLIGDFKTSSEFVVEAERRVSSNRQALSPVTVITAEIS